ncbi:hypothetical protein D4R52_03630 [bacterium]|nr:MAG: hypothetical protein D4R52_03630 [bacterium]
MIWPTKKLGQIINRFRKNRKLDVYCAVCNTARDGDSRFCKRCNRETGNLFKREQIENLKMHTSISAKQKRPGFGFVKKLFQGFKLSGDPRLADGVDVQMVADCEKNEWHHIVKDNKSGKIIHEEHELLAEHRSKMKNNWPTKKLEAISSAEVLKVFDEEHNQQDGSNGWARRALIEADKKFNGKWGRIELKRKQILQIILSHHQGEGGEIELVPKTGFTVEEAINKIKSISCYKIKNPKCWEKIEYLKTESFSPIFLSIGQIDWDDYKSISISNGEHFFHLDGLHRLISWGLDGRLDAWTYFRGSKIIAYIAGL